LDNPIDFFKRERKYLGHVISEEGVRTNPEKTQAINDWKVPKVIIFLLENGKINVFITETSFHHSLKSSSAIGQPH
jgi:hypothetical protein